jgi:cytochrome P450
MVLHPDIQTKAQTELDSILGNDQLPQFSDRPFLPYIEAIVKEVFRWFPVAPTGFLFPIFHGAKLIVVIL